MIELFCDVCGEKYGTYEKKSELPDDTEISNNFPFIHACDKCRTTFNEMDYLLEVQRAVLKNRKDIPTNKYESY